MQLEAGRVRAMAGLNAGSVVNKGGVVKTLIALIAVVVLLWNCGEKKSNPLAPVSITPTPQPQKVMKQRDIYKWIKDISYFDTSINHYSKRDSLKLLRADYYDSLGRSVRSDLSFQYRFPSNYSLLYMPFPLTKNLSIVDTVAFLKYPISTSMTYTLEGFHSYRASMIGNCDSLYLSSESRLDSLIDTSGCSDGDTSQHCASVKELIDSFSGSIGKWQTWISKSVMKYDSLGYMVDKRDSLFVSADSFKLDCRYIIKYKFWE